MIVHVLCINVQELLTIYRHLPFPIPIPKATSNHDMTIHQSILNQQLSPSDFKEIFHQADIAFPIVEEALFVSRQEKGAKIAMTMWFIDKRDRVLEHKHKHCKWEDYSYASVQM